MNITLEQAIALKQQIVDFIYDAEGEIATALEQYAVDHGSRYRQDIRHQNLVVDTFLTEGKVGTQTPIDLFLETQTDDLSPGDREVLRQWHRSFTGLFEVIKISSDQVKLMNWLTAKYYIVLPSAEVPLSEIQRWKPGEILLTRLSPLTSESWIFSGDCIPKGQLSQPKLAVAIGEFKQNYKQYLYSDAPELLEQAWVSVQHYHQAFVDFFGTDKITLPGYQLNQKIAVLQEKLAQKQLEEAGIDPTKSLSDLIQDMGADESDLAAGAEVIGADSQSIRNAYNSKKTLGMITPKAELPPEIRQAEAVTAFSHPRWGQLFIPSYTQLTTLLKQGNFEENESLIKVLIQKYLEDSSLNYYIWQQLRDQYPTQLESLLRYALERPQFNLESDLEDLLKSFNKSLEPELSEMASVPLHLHQLFQAAIHQVNSSKSKKKKKQKKVKGFQI